MKGEKKWLITVFELGVGCVTELAGLWTVKSNQIHIENRKVVELMPTMAEN